MALKPLKLPAAVLHLLLKIIGGPFWTFMLHAPPEVKNGSLCLPPTHRPWPKPILFQKESAWRKLRKRNRLSATWQKTINLLGGIDAPVRTEAKKTGPGRFDRNLNGVLNCLCLEQLQVYSWALILVINCGMLENQKTLETTRTTSEWTSALISPNMTD